MIYRANLWNKAVIVFVLVYINNLVAQDSDRCMNCRYGPDYCSNDDRCLFGCESGFHGDGCHDSCQIQNCVECVQLASSLEQCTLCTGNFYGPLCNYDCSRNCKGLGSRSSCDQNGNCIFGCEEGYHGDQCYQVRCDFENCLRCDVNWQGHINCAECAAGYYWNLNYYQCSSCSQFCATPDDCNPYTGECNNGCRVGYFGKKCEYHCDISECNTCYALGGNSYDTRCSACVEGFYPTTDQKACRACSSECTSCDSTTGACTHCENGTLGDRCEFHCSDIPNCETCKLNHMHTGIVCSVCKTQFYLLHDTCVSCPANCADGLCDTLGTCLSCKEGYYGKQDKHRESCSFRCSENCVGGKCDEDHGNCSCKTGWFGSRCDRNCPLKCASCAGFQNGKCFSCEYGYYGDLCNKRCSEHCESRSTGLPTCVQASGHCDLGCLSGYYGAMCNKSCSSNCDGHICDKSTGTCLTGCSVYWYGDKCDERCSDNCISKDITSINRPCDMSSGRCLQGCKGRYFGERCDQLCNYRCREQMCHQDTGICKYGCMDGFSGTNCSESCGTNCEDHCANCIDRYCDALTRVCNKGCIKGFYGEKCQINCSPNCHNQDCHAENGICFLCEKGFYGPFCTLRCSPMCEGGCEKTSGSCRQCMAGRYGPHCNLKCPDNCRSMTCRPDTGGCDDGCRAGFFGHNCIEECWSGYYGENCEFTCGQCRNGEQCLKTNGHCTSGCEDGYAGDTCHQALSQSGPMVYDSNRVAMIAGTSVSALLVVCIIIVVALLCYRRSLKAKRAKREEPTVVFTTADSSVQMQQSAGSMIVQTESDVSLHQVDSNLLGSQEADIRYSGIVAHRDYYTLHRGTVSNHGSREDTFVKVLLLNDTVEKQTHLSWLKKEVEILQLCSNHPNIISLLTTHETPERLGVALGSCMQNNLMPYLHEISLSEDDDVETFFNHQLIQFVIDISDALCHLHRHQIIHRYLRARSIYLSDNLVAKVGDFDYAVLVEDENSTADDLGWRDLPSTFNCWLSPEALISNRFSPQSDIWSFGMLLWEIFTLGQWPYDRLEGSKLERAIKEGERPPKPELASVAMYRLMKNCWRYSPDDRPTAELVLCHLTETQIEVDTHRLIRVTLYGTRHEKTCLQDVLQSQFQTSLLSYRD